MGDPEYVLAMFNIVLPVAYQFNPDLVLVSAGFDAARGDPLGGCKVSPEMYGHMTHHLMNLARGRVIVALEGGYNLNSIALSMTMCAKALAGDPLPSIMPERDPKLSAIQSIRDVIGVHSKFWSCLRFGVKLPDSFEDLREGIKTPRKMKPGLGGDAVAEKQDTIQEAGNKASAISPSQAVSRSSDYIPNQYGTQAVSNSAYIPNEFGACFSASYVTSQSTSSNSYKRSLPSEERVTDSKVHSQAEMNRQAEEAFKMMQKVELVSPNRRSHTDYIPQQFGSQSFGSVTVQTFSNSTSGPKCQVTDTKKKEAPN